MEKYYTLDSVNGLSSSCQVILGAYTPTQHEQAVFLSQMYPDGLSKHGYNYLYNPGPVMNDNSNESKALLIGLVFELVRLSHFPDKPSRYQSLFACQHLSEVRQFRELLADEQKSEQIRIAPIYEVITNGPVHRGDMRLLNSDCPVLELYRRAHLYWAGEAAPVKEGEKGDKPFWELLIPLPVVVGHRIAE